MRLKIKVIRYLRSMGILKEPTRSYLYNGKRYPFYKAPIYSTSDGKLFIRTKELFNSVKFIKTI